MLLPLWSHCAAVSSLLLFFFLGFFGQFPFRSILWIFLLLEMVDLTVHVQSGVNLNSLLSSYLSSNVFFFQCQAGTAKDLTKSRSCSKFIMCFKKSKVSPFQPPSRRCHHPQLLPQSSSWSFLMDPQLDEAMGQVLSRIPPKFPSKNSFNLSHNCCLLALLGWLFDLILIKVRKITFLAGIWTYDVHEWKWGRTTKAYKIVTLCKQ